MRLENNAYDHKENHSHEEESNRASEQCTTTKTKDERKRCSGCKSDRSQDSKKRKFSLVVWEGLKNLVEKFKKRVAKR